MTIRKLRVGTRTSRLALAQTTIITNLLKEATEGLELQVIPVKTRGDVLPASQRGETDGKGIFTEDIESLLLTGELDLAVHSMKDLSLTPDPALMIAASPPRGDPRDSLVSTGNRLLKDLSKGASLGTSSLRRKVQLTALRKDLCLVDLHGNVETRVRKMVEFGLDGIVLAAAGLDRLSLGEKIAERFPPNQLVPAAGQGALAVQTRRRDTEVTRLVYKISDPKTIAATECEREFAREMGADCSLPIGAFASFEGRLVTLTGMIASMDGTGIVRRSISSTDLKGVGTRLAREMLDLSGELTSAGGTR